LIGSTARASGVAPHTKAAAAISVRERLLIPCPP
jgi:hypothetical protein